VPRWLNRAAAKDVQRRVSYNLANDIDSLAAQVVQNPSFTRGHPALRYRRPASNISFENQINRAQLANATAGHGVANANKWPARSGD